MSVLSEPLQEKYEVLLQTFRDMESVLVAFSGGVDSTLVLKVASDALGPSARAVTALSPTFPQNELKQVQGLSRAIGVPLQLVQTDQLQIDEFVKNDVNRCFHCKTDLYGLLSGIREQEGFKVIVDGTNVDDLGEDRPGIRAAREWGVRSPLVEAEMGKSDIRELARYLGLANWDKPAAACLSSRVVRGLPITKIYLSRIDHAEAFLMEQGFRQVRVRLHGELARIEVEASEIPRLLDAAMRAIVVEKLQSLGFATVTIDLEGYRAGGGNVGHPDGGNGSKKKGEGLPFPFP